VVENKFLFGCGSVVYVVADASTRLTAGLLVMAMLVVGTKKRE